MELSSPKPKKLFIFFQKKCLVFWNETFQHKARKTKKKHPEKISYIFPQKNFLIFWDAC